MTISFRKTWPCIQNILQMSQLIISFAKATSLYNIYKILKTERSVYCISIVLPSKRPWVWLLVWKPALWGRWLPRPCRPRKPRLLRRLQSPLQRKPTTLSTCTETRSAQPSQLGLVQYTARLATLTSTFRLFQQPRYTVAR